MKTCTKCGKEKTEEEFPRNLSGKNGLNSFCKDCKKKRTNRWCEANRDKLSRRSRLWGDKHRFSVALKNSCKSAKKYGYFPCDATVEEIEAAFTGRCHHCDKIETDNGRKLGIDHDHKTGEFRGWLCNVCNAKDVLALLGRM